MKIALPVETESMETKICPSFGRTPFFLLYDTEAQGGQFINNSAADSQGGAGIKAAQLIIDQGVTVLLTPRCGKNAAELFLAADIKLYKTVSSLAADNLKDFMAGHLNILEDFHEGFHGRS